MEWYAAYLAFTLFLAGMAWYPCGCATGCDKCSATDTHPTVTIANATGYNCVCNYFNKTWVLNPDVGNACRWFYYEFAGFLCGVPPVVGGFTVSAEVKTIAGTYQWEAIVDWGGTGGSGQVIFRWDSGAATPFDCTATRTLTYVSHSDPWPGCANHSSWTCQVN